MWDNEALGGDTILELTFLSSSVLDTRHTGIGSSKYVYLGRNVNTLPWEPNKYSFKI